MEKEQIFPMSVSSDDMVEFYTKEKELSAYDFMDMVKDMGMELYPEVVEFYLQNNLPDEPWYTIIHEAEPIIKDVENTNGSHWVLEEFCVDITHLKGYRGEDLQILIIPFMDEETNSLFGSAIKDIRPAQFWHDGEFVGDNVEDFDSDFSDIDFGDCL